jgi:DNA-binding LytR/AlgR family response regulator
MGKVEGLLMVEEAITHLTGASNYTWIHFWNGEKQRVAKPISAFERLLTRFSRVHKTALVNPAYVTDLQAPLAPKKSGVITLQHTIDLPVSRRRWETVAATLTSEVEP